MKKIKVAFLTAIVFTVFASFPIYSQNSDFNTGKALNIQYEILKAINSQYVDTVTMDKLIYDGVDAMLSTLDPYSVFIPQENEDDLDMMTTGSYGGVGSLIKKLPSGEVMISEPYADSPAVKTGLQPGDLILEIDGESVYDLDASQCSAKMRGKPNSELKMKVVKTRTKDTVDIVLIRERIHVSDVVYYGMVSDSVGYIQIGGFTMGGAKDVRKAVEQLTKNSGLKRLVLDLRSNGGGLMSEAIEIVSLFVPSNTLVVTSKGKFAYASAEYRTNKEPIDTQIPLMVLVNSGTASSSEIVAGAFQDLDRATIIGTRTFGKGLVQSIREVGYGSVIKLTTAKYYTPSGRCLQALDYSHRNEDGSVGAVPDSLKKAFKTAGGRTVYDGGGITPDIEIEPYYYNRAIAALVVSDIMGDYSIEYYRDHNTILPPDQFNITDQDYDAFVKFAQTRDFDFRSEAEIEMDRVIEAAKRDGLYDEYSTSLNEMKDQLTLQKEEFLTKNSDMVRKLVEQEIIVKYYYSFGRAQKALTTDFQLYNALEAWAK